MNDGMVVEEYQEWICMHGMNGWNSEGRDDFTEQRIESFQETICGEISSCFYQHSPAICPWSCSTSISFVLPV